MIHDRQRAAGELRQKIDTRAANCAVVGLGFVGTMEARLLSRKGFSVTGFDLDANRVCALQGHRDLGQDGLRFSSSDFSLTDADIIFVCVRVCVKPDGTANLQAIESVIRAIKNRRQDPTLVVVVTTVPVGTTRWLTSQLTCDNTTCWFVAFAPERIAADHSIEEVLRIPRLVAGFDSYSRNLGCALLDHICQRPVPLSTTEACELGKLLENVFRTQSIALIGEITRAAHAWGIDASEVCAAAATKPFGYFAFHPGPGVGGHCLPNDLRILQNSFTTVGQDSDLLAAVQAAVAEIPVTAIHRLEQALSRSLNGCDVLIVGVGFKPDSGDATATPAESLIELLWQRGANVTFLDTKITKLQVAGRSVARIDRTELESLRFHAVLIVAGDRDVNLAELYSVADVVLDTAGARIMVGDTSALIRL